MEKQLYPLYWLWIPVAFMSLQISLEIFTSRELQTWMISENGPVETLQALILVVAIGVALSWFFTKAVKTPLLNAWFGLAALCCFYVAGEEVSWGQHIWNWSTPEYWAQVNDQQETNLHNTSSWLDQKPRLILELGIIFGALVAPILKKYGLLKLPEKLDILMPSPKLAVIALLILVPKLLEKLFELVDIAIFARISEIQEVYMFYFVLIYLIMLKTTVGRRKTT